MDARLVVYQGSVSRLACRHRISQSVVHSPSSRSSVASLRKRSTSVYTYVPEVNMQRVTLILTLFTFLLCSTLRAQAANSKAVSPTVSEFFGIDGNLTTVTWAHAVNSLALLNASLLDQTIMMFEADIVMGTLNTTSDKTLIPVMGHPPANESDLSLEEFLNAVLNDTKRGVKLDFKTIEVFEASREILAKVRPNMTFPVWINADILPGPVEAEGTPVDASAFLTGAAETFPESTLSIGWTTRYGTAYNITTGNYTTDQVNEMINTTRTNNATQPITYPVRAGLAAQSIDAMQKLINDSSNGTTLTIWSSDGDSVDTGKLSELILKIGVDKVYIDVPEAVWAGLDIRSSASGMKMGALAFGTTLAALAIGRLF